MTTIAVTSEFGLWADFGPEEYQSQAQDIPIQTGEEAKFIWEFDSYYGTKAVQGLFKYLLEYEKYHTLFQVTFALNLVFISSLLMKVTHYAVLLVLLSVAVLLRRLAHLTTVLLIGRHRSHGVS